MSLLLSVMIVSLSAGVALVNCCHSGEASVAQLSVGHGGSGDDMCCTGGQCDEEKECACPRTMNCMSVTVLKLAPSNLAQHVSYSFSAVAHAVPFLCGVLPQPVVLSAVRSAAFAAAAAGFHSPPRCYLHFLRVLRL